MKKKKEINEIRKKIKIKKIKNNQFQNNNK